MTKSIIKQALWILESMVLAFSLLYKKTQST